jgi:NADPH-dependent curcumin reductase CurA
MSEIARRVVLASRPVGEPKPENFRLEEFPVPKPGPGEVLLRTVWLSLDPYMRGRMSDAPSYAPPVQIGQAMVAGTICEVAQTNNPDFATGDLVTSFAGWQTHALSDGKGLRKIDTKAAPAQAFLGVLGMPGLTAYAGLLEIGKPQPGETVVVAAASGPVGSMVGQIAQIKGARAIGIAGGPKKCAFVKNDLKFADCLDHRAPDFAERLAAACPKGIDVYFENVGGAVFDAVLPLLNPFARVPVCGLVSMYNATELPPGPNRLPLLMRAVLSKRINLRGFIVSDFFAKQPEFLREATAWLKEGRITYCEDIVEGLENAPRALIGLLKGENFGKVVVRVAPESKG